jgi:hypothetical protein
MQGLLDFKDGCSLHPSFYCQGANGIYQPFVSIEEAKQVIIPCNNPGGKNIITCLHPHKSEFLEEVNGLSFDLKMRSAFDALPSYVPIVDYGCRNSYIPDQFEVVGVSLADIIKNVPTEFAGRLRAAEQFRLRTNLLKCAAFSGKKVILFLSGADVLIEEAWYQRSDLRLFEEIKAMGFYAATGFNFSVIGGECSFSHALNLKRSMVSASIIQQNDVIAIPHVYGISQRQLERWTTWFLRNPEVRLFAMNCQLQKTAEDIRQVVHVVNSLLNHFPYMHVLLQGFHMNKLYLFGDHVRRVHIADKKPFKYAHSKTRIKHDLETGKTGEEYTTGKNLQELIADNLFDRKQFMEYQRSKSLV